MTQVYQQQSRPKKGIKSNHQKVNTSPTKCINVSGIIMTCHSNANRKKAKHHKLFVSLNVTAYILEVLLPPHQAGILFLKRADRGNIPHSAPSSPWSMVPPAKHAVASPHYHAGWSPYSHASRPGEHECACERRVTSPPRRRARSP